MNAWTDFSKYRTLNFMRKKNMMRGIKRKQTTSAICTNALSNTGL